MNKKNFLLKNGLLLFIILCSISFFEIRVFPVAVLKSLEFVGVGLILITIFIHSVYDNGPRMPKNFSVEIMLILASVVLSMTGAYLLHNQSFAITAVVQRYMYFFLLYYMLHQVRPEPNDVLKIIIYLGLTYACLYFVQYLLYPFEVVHSKSAEARGTIRIFFPGSIYLFLTLFLCLSQYFTTQNLKYLFIVLLAFVIVILLGTRQVLFTMLFLIIMYILFSKKVKSKIGVFFLVGLSLIPFYFMFQGIIVSLLQISQNQSQNLANDTRYKEIMFFLFKFSPNTLAYILGNGVASSNSAYGIHIEQLKEYYGFYQSDIGLIGDYTKFGILFVIGQFSGMFKILTWKLGEKMIFIKLLLWSMALTLVTGGSFASADTITAVCLIFYLVDAHVFLENSTVRLEPVKLDFK